MDARYHLEELKGSDYKIVDGEPDILGWTIRDNAGLKIGKVRDLLFDTGHLKVRYLITHLKDNDLNLQDKEVLIPMGLILLDPENETVLVRRISNTYFNRTPAYVYDQLSPEYESQIYDLFREQDQIPPATFDRDNFYENDNFYNDYFKGRE